VVLECPGGSCGRSPDAGSDVELVEVQRHLEITTSNNEHDGLKYGHERRDCEVTKSILIIGC